MSEGKTHRRQILALGGLIALGLAAPGLFGLVRGFLPVDLDLEPLAEPAGFRILGGGASSSSGFDPLFGLQSDRPRAAGNLETDLCTALFGPEPAPAGVVPIAAFSDYLCPYCKLLTQRLAALQAASPGEVRIAWHEWPILGPTSIEAARAALAAKRQGAYVGFQAELMRAGFVPTESLFEDLALRLGLDPGRFAADRRSAEVEQEIATTRALADRFGFPGTPALVVGRTVVTGSIDDATLRALIARERADGPLDVCAGARPA